MAKEKFMPIDSKSKTQMTIPPLKIGELSFPPRKVWMKTFGCQMNWHDTERLFVNLESLNFKKTLNQEKRIDSFQHLCDSGSFQSKILLSPGGSQAPEKEKAPYQNWFWGVVWLKWRPNPSSKDTLTLILPLEPM